MSERYELRMQFDTEEAAGLAAHVIYIHTGKASKIRKVNPDAHPE